MSSLQFSGGLNVFINVLSQIHPNPLDLLWCSVMLRYSRVFMPKSLASMLSIVDVERIVQSCMSSLQPRPRWRSCSSQMVYKKVFKNIPYWYIQCVYTYIIIYILYMYIIVHQFLTDSIYSRFQHVLIKMIRQRKKNSWCHLDSFATGGRSSHRDDAIKPR